ncbi:MAG: tetratricopeptide repeat protein, partial [Deltaproteobacteria bacterium]|nr:tetratricopeptide repeat protein [Deltaproteobacteria bacterium]
DPLNVDACRSLERLYTAQDKWRELVEIYEVWLAAVDDPDLQCDLLTKTAVIQEEEFHDAPAATLAYERILQLQPEHLHAIRSLERLNRALGRWPELIEVYRRHLDAARGDLDVSINLLQATGSIFAGQLRDRDQAIESYRRILDLDPQHRQALQALAGLYEQAGDWEATVAMLQQLRDVLDDRAARVELAFRVGLIQRNEMQDEAQAEEWFYQALDEDPYYLPAIEHLREMAYQRQDWRGAVQLLKRQEEATRDLLEKAKVLLAIGKIYQERENDPLSASTYFERCIEYDPENVEAASPLVEMYLHERRWERAEPLLDLLVRRLGKSRHTEGIHQIHHQAGLCSENLFKDDKALRHYRNAYELDATHLPTLEGLGRLLYKREDWDRAFKIYQTILVHHRDKQTDAQQVEIFFRLGVIKLKVGERARGRQMFEKALELDQHHRPTLEGLVDLHEKQGDWDKVVHYKRAMLATLDGEDLKRFDLLVDVANIWREKLRNMAKAIEAYNEALAIDPQSRQVMHHLLNLYTQEKEWPYAVEILLRTIQLEERPDKVARYCYTAGVIYRDELKDDEQAVALFNQALDADPGMLKAFEAIDRIQTRIKAWQLLERNYRKMIKRVTDTGCGGEELQVLLWRNLGEIYRTRMIRHEEAATAFGMASKIMPKDMQLHEIIAELYDRSPDSKDKALAEHRRMLELEKFRYSSYKALSRLYAETNQFDKAWCFAAALSLARQASAEEDEFYKRFRGQTLKYANRPLEREMWQNLYHPAENLHLGGIFATLALYNPFPTSSLKDWNVKKRDLLELSKPLVFNKVFKTTVQALNMTSHVPQVYLKGEGHMGMKNGYTEPWSLIIGPDMLQGRPERELAFLLGKALTLFRPEHYLAGVLPTSHLKILFYAALKLTHPESNVPLPTEAEAFAEILRHMQKTLPPPILADLDKRVSLVLRARIEVDLSGWLDGVDATSNRVGLLLCGDLETATRLIRSEQGAIGKASAQQRAEDLFLWSISEEYFSLRKALGLTIG